MRNPELNQLLQNLIRQAAGDATGLAPDAALASAEGLSLDDDSPISVWLREYLAEAHSAQPSWSVRPASLASVKRLPLPGISDFDLALAVLDRLLALLDDPVTGPHASPFATAALLSYLLPRTKPRDASDPLKLLHRIDTHPQVWSGYGLPSYSPTLPIVRAAVRMIGIVGLTPELRAVAEEAHAAGERLAGDADRRKATALLKDLIAMSAPEERLLDPTDDWGVPAQAAFESLAGEQRSGWARLLLHGAYASGSRPTASWLREARSNVEELGSAAARELIERWLGLLAERGAGSQALPVGGFGEVRPSSMIPERNASLLRGLLWTCLLFDDAAMARTVGQATRELFRKIPEFGSRSTKAGNAGVYVLGQLTDRESVAQLDHLAQTIKLPSAQKVIDAALTTASERAGLTRHDLEELSVPSFGLNDGQIEWRLGEHRLVVAVEGAESLIHWYSPVGEPLRAAPAAVRRAYGPEIKHANQVARDLRAALAVQRGRLESLYLDDRGWSYQDWLARYLDHPLLSTLARRLIWQFETSEGTVTGAWIDGQIVDAADRPVEKLLPACEVRLWHPLTSTPADVLAWRGWLSRHEVCQPFKQAHREIYLITEAELSTESYSNRFAAHVLRQHQLSALCLERGWRYRLQGDFDGWNPPTKPIPAFGIEARWDVFAPQGDSPISRMGISLVVTTGQVRFFRADGSVRLAEVPPLVFSEIMRDVDLFVGVCSVGNDPTWAEDAPERYRDYWTRYSVGDLEVSARSRGEVLRELLPKLKIADRCQVEDRFLVVRGDLHTYRIHLGSGNILMEPNNQYLCIVPARGGGIETSGSRVFLPFEGDGLLSIILSKAFLLADDRSITDLSITHQIG